MKGRNPTAEEKRHMSAVAALGCIVCKIHNDIYTPCGIHHTDGKTKPGAHFKVLGLCDGHHQISSPTGEWATRHGPGRNAGKSNFEEAYGTEEWLMAQTEELLLV